MTHSITEYRYSVHSYKEKYECFADYCEIQFLVFIVIAVYNRKFYEKIKLFTKNETIRTEM